MFTVLPFGLSTACYIFTKVVRPLVRYWRAKGLRFLDDGLCAVSGAQAAQEVSQFVKSTIDKAGFIAHPEKSIWQPTQWLMWLGFVVDVGLEVPSEKITALRSALHQASQSPWIKARNLASVIGKIISMGLAFGHSCIPQRKDMQVVLQV